MIHLLYEPLPETILADGEEHPILTDFRAWLQFIGLVNDRELPAAYKVLAMQDWLVEPHPVTGAIVEGLCGFCRAAALELDRRAEEDAPPESRRPPRFDWVADAGCVLADFRRFYQIDLLRVEFLHWWEFRALFSALPEESVTMRRTAIRSVDLSKVENKTRRQELARMQRQLALPFEMDEDGIADVFAEVM